MSPRARLRVGAVAVILALVAGIAPGPVGGTARAAVAVTGLYLDTMPGDGVGNGMPALWPTIGGGYTATDGHGITAIGTTAFSQGMTQWRDLSFTAPAGRYLESGGTYTGGVSITGMCSLPHSSGFEILELQSASTRELAVTFWIECTDGGPVFVGDLRRDSVVPFRVFLADRWAADLGSAPAGTTGDATTFTVTSGSLDPLAISSVSISPSGSDFALETETCTAAPVTTGDGCQVVVRFTPRAGGRRSADLVFFDDTARGRHAIALDGIGTLPASPVPWGATRVPPSAYTWNTGEALARTVTTGTSGYLHAVAVTDRVGSRWVTDGGPYTGVMYTRSGNDGATWTAAVRLNPATQHGDQAKVATSGKSVYVAWISQKRWVGWSGSLARTLYVRANANHGTGTWGSIKRLTSLTGRVGTPTIAASGANVYVAYTDSVTGSVKLAISRDRGATWSTVALGTTTASSSSGRFGVPVVSATGTLVVVSWTANANWAIKARVSTNSGASWAAAVTLASAADSASSAATAVGRAAVAWASPDGIRVRTWKSGSWRADRIVVLPYTGQAYREAWWPAVSLSGTARIGVAFPACWADCSEAVASTRADLVWAESKDEGMTWYADQVLGSATVSSRRVNSYPSVVWYGSTRAVSWVGEAITSGYVYRVYLRTGIGAP